MKLSKDKQLILEILNKLHSKHKERFQLMYGTELNYEDISDESLYNTVTKMDNKKVKFALLQCQRTYYSLFDILKTSHL